MKSFSFYLILLFITFALFTGCQKMDSTYKEYVVPGGIIYTGKAVSPEGYAGHNRVKIIWLKGNDPSVTKARIFWNNYADSVEIDIPSTADTISAMIDRLKENSYSFMIKTYDANQHSSVPVEVITAAYGDSYAEGLLNRSPNSSIMNDEGIVNISWGSADISNGAYATEIKYTDTTGLERVIFTPVNEAATSISDLMGSTYESRTLFLPDPMAIDTFYTDFQTQQVLGKRQKFTTTGWTITGTDFRSGGEPENALDGNSDTFWWTAPGSSTPYFLTVDMGEEKQAIYGVYLQQRLSSPNPHVQNFEIQVSAEGIEWKSLGIFEAADNSDVQYFDFLNPQDFRYFKILCNTIYDNKTNASLAEFGVFQR